MGDYGGCAVSGLSMMGANWTLKVLRIKREVRVKNGLILFDDETGKILITRWWHDYSPRNR
jgi:hypothetical protein